MFVEKKKQYIQDRRMALITKLLKNSRSDEKAISSASIDEKTRSHASIRPKADFYFTELENYFIGRILFCN